MKPHQKKRKIESNFKINKITFVLIVAVIIIFVSVYDKTRNEMEAEKITKIIMDDHGMSFASGG